MLIDGLRQLEPDLVTFQEAIVDEEYDQVVDLLGPTYHVAHQRVGLIGDGRHHGASIASRWPFQRAHEVDLHVTPRTGDYSCGAIVAEIGAPEPLGRLLLVDHGPSWRGGPSLNGSGRRWPQQRSSRIWSLTDPRMWWSAVTATPAPAASMRFWTGRQSLDGTSVAYRDAWESIHGNDLGLTFDPANPLTAEDEPGQDRGRHIDYLLVRCTDHGPTLGIADCRLTFAAPVGGVWASDHFGLVADLAAAPPAGA